MSKRGPDSFMKRQKELKRMQRAQEKMARRHGKRNQVADITAEAVAEPLGGQTEADISPK